MLAVPFSTMSFTHFLQASFWDRGWLSSGHSGQLWAWGGFLGPWTQRYIIESHLGGQLLVVWLLLCGLSAPSPLGARDISLHFSLNHLGVPMFHSFSLMWGDLRRGPCAGTCWDPVGSMGEVSCGKQITSLPPQGLCHRQSPLSAFVLRTLNL